MARDRVKWRFVTHRAVPRTAWEEEELKFVLYARIRLLFIVMWVGRQAS